MAAMIRDETRILRDVSRPPTRARKELGLAAAPDRGGEEEAVTGLGESWCARTLPKGPRTPRAPPARSAGGRARGAAPPPPPPPLFTPRPSRGAVGGGIAAAAFRGRPPPLPPAPNGRGGHACAGVSVRCCPGGCDVRGASQDGRTGEAVCHTGAVPGPLRVARWGGGLRPALASRFPNHVPSFCCLAGGSLSPHPPKPSQLGMASR